MDILFSMDINHKKKRIEYLDIAKGIGMILVLLGHLQNDTVFSFSPHILSLCSWIFSFHMPFFFIISGMLICIKKDNEKDLHEFIKKRFHSIMIPYFWFSLIYIGIVLYSLLITKVVPLKTLFIQLWYVISMYGMNVLWFLPALFAAEVIFVFITKHFKGRRSVITIIILVLAAITLNELRAFLPNNPELFTRIDEFTVTLIRPVFACSYIFIGFGFYKGIEMIKAKCKNTVPLILVSLLPFFAINFYINTLNRPVDFRSMVLNRYPLYYISSTCGSVFLILFCILLSRIPFGRDEDKRFRLLKYYGINSLVFMAVHNNSAVMHLSLLCSMYINQFLTRARGYICYAVVVAIFLIYVSLTIWAINKFFPFITGRPYNRRK